MSRKRTEDRSPPPPCPTVHRPPSPKRHCTGMSVSSTRNEPAHYMLKVESFSVLTENPTIKIESDVFEASGHKWRLELDLSGKEDEKGANHISLYLIICDNIEYLPKGWKILVDVKFFVYNHIAHNYVTFQDGDASRTRFQEKQLKWGFDKLISLYHFKDSNKGYLLTDSCVFGAEVFVVPEYTQKDRCLSLTKPPVTMNTYSWTIDNLLDGKTNYANSEVFKVGKVKWTLSLIPRRPGPGACINVTCVLKVHEPNFYPEGWRVYANFELRLKNQSGYDDIVKETDHWFCELAPDSGYQSFLPLNELRDTTKGFLLNDRLIVEAKILVIGIQKNFV